MTANRIGRINFQVCVCARALCVCVCARARMRVLYVYVCVCVCVWRGVVTRRYYMVHAGRGSNAVRLRVRDTNKHYQPYSDTVTVCVCSFVFE